MGTKATYYKAIEEVVVVQPAKVVIELPPETARELYRFLRNSSLPADLSRLEMQLSDLPIWNVSDRSPSPK